MAAKLQCEICGGKLVGKPGGIFECENCGTEYSTAWAKEKIQEITGKVQVEGTVEVTGKVQVEGGTVQVDTSANKDALLKRAFMTMEEANWEKANELLEQVLNTDPECAEAYLGKLMIEKKVKNREGLKQLDTPSRFLTLSNNYKKAVQYGDEKLKAELSAVMASMDANRTEKLYRSACQDAAEGTILSLEEAAARFGSLRSYKDSEQRQAECLSRAEALRDSKGSFFRQANRLTKHRIAAYESCSYGLKADGTVLVAGNNKDAQCNVSAWREITAIAVGKYDVVGLKSNGTVVTAGSSKYDTSQWSNIVAVSAGVFHIVGLKADGSAVAVGRDQDGQCNVSTWKDIAAIAAGSHHTVGLKKDGTVVAVGYNQYCQCNVSGWKDITAIAADGDRTVGLKADGTVVVTDRDGSAEKIACNMKGVIDIALTWRITGLYADGTVGVYDGTKVEPIRDWKDIVAFAGSSGHMIGLKTDGTVVSKLRHLSLMCEEIKVSDWRLFNSAEPVALREELRQAAARRAEEDRQEELARRREEKEKKIKEIELRIKIDEMTLQNGYKGLFLIKVRRRKQAEIEEARAELARLKAEIRDGVL